MDKKKRSAYGVPKFFLDNKEAKITGIYLKFSFAHGKRLSFFTGQRIEPAKWSFDTQRAKRNVTGASDLNDILNLLSETAIKIVRQAKVKGQDITAEQIKTALSEAIGKQSSGSDFFNLYDEFVKSESKLKSWSTGTIARFQTVKNHLQNFNKKLTVNDIDVEALVTFFHDSGLRNSTAQKQVKILQWFLNWCQKTGYANKVTKLKADLKQASHKVIYLSLDEIRHLAALNLTGYLERTRDIFVFQCLTGLRFSDLRNLKATDISNGDINVSTIKTGENVTIPLTGTTTGILQKYSEFQQATGQALPVPANAVYNKFLKELANKAELKDPITIVYYKGAERIEKTFEKSQLISSHSARRSFITNALTAGIQSEVIRSWTGHTNDDSFKQYYEIVKQRQQMDMAKLEL